jgi:hypothetical protein
MRITSAGNVGIGTSSPAQKLEVNGITYINTASPIWEILQLNNTTSGSAAFARMSSAAGGNVDIGAEATTASTLVLRTAAVERMRIAANGWVGVGRIPQGIFDIHGSGSGAVSYFYAGGSIVYSDIDTHVWRRAAGPESMRLDSSGNLLVGKTDVSVTTNGVTIGNANYIASSRNSDVAGFFVRSGTDGDAVAFYKTTTNVGSISVTSSATSYNTSSDYRLKDINGPVVNSGAYIDALKPVQGSWKADGSRFIGLLAHEVQEVSETPIATGEKDGEKMQAMDYSAPELIANLIAEIQSLRARVAQLEGN